MEKSMYWYKGNQHTLTNTYTAALTTKQFRWNVLFPPFLKEHIPLSQIKMTYKQNARRKQVLKENG